MTGEWFDERPRAETEDGIPSELPPERRKPSLQAEIFTFTENGNRKSITEPIPSEIEVQSFDDPDAYYEALSGNVAVAVLSTKIAESQIETIIKRTIRVSEHARIMLVATDHQELLQVDVPADESVTLSSDEEEFNSLVKRLYVRAYYEVTLERFYEISIAIRNLELRQQSEAEDSDTLQRYRTARKLLRSYLTQFRRYLEPEDFVAMENRQSHLDRLAAESKAGQDPSVVGLPDTCPDCDLDWTAWHGPRLQSGYRKIGANSWRCTQCGNVLSDRTADGYRIQ